MRDSLIRDLRRQIGGDADKLFQLETLLLGWSMYEYFIDVRRCKLAGNLWTARVHTHSRGKRTAMELRAAPVVSVRWQMSEENIDDLRRGAFYLMIRNVWLKRSYVEEWATS